MVTHQNLTTAPTCENNNTTLPFISPRQQYILKMKLSEKEVIEKCQKVLRIIRSAMSRQRNINMGVKNSVFELEKLVDVIRGYSKNCREAEK